MLPLSGRTILVTRGNSQAQTIIDEIEQHGGEVIHTPLVTFQMNNTYENQQILKQLHDYAWVFFTSSNGVKFFFDILKEVRVDLPDSIRFAVVGMKTEKTLEKYGYQADFMPSSYNALNMATEFFERFGSSSSILYVRGNRSRDELVRFFREQRVFFQSVTAYDTLLMKDHKNTIEQLVREERLDALTFTSPSTVKAFCEMMTMEQAVSIPCFCIGPTTAEQAEQAGFRHISIPERYTIEDMVDKLSQYFQEGER